MYIARCSKNTEISISQIGNGLGNILTFENIEIFNISQKIILTNEIFHPKNYTEVMRFKTY